MEKITRKQSFIYYFVVMLLELIGAYGLIWKCGQNFFQKAISASFQQEFRQWFMQIMLILLGMGLAIVVLFLHFYYCMYTNIEESMQRLNNRNMELENFSQMRKEFVSNVTHELKTPLTSIRGFVDTLKNGALDDPEYAEHFLDIIDIEAERLGKLIQDILVLSEIESKDAEVKKEEFVWCDLQAIWEEVKELLNGRQKIAVELEGKIEENTPPFYGNPDQLKEILLNLTDNALTYTEIGFVKVYCKKEENNLKIEVKDSGIGISEEHLDRLFERFYRVDKGRSRKQGGTGLGLSIVKHIVELYAGKIEVTSKVGQGTTFQVSLPYVNPNMKNSGI